MLVNRWRVGTARLIAACVILSVLAALAGCGPEPTPLVPTTLPTIAPVPTPISTPFPTVTIKLLRADPLAAIRDGEITAGLSTVVSGTYCTPAWSATTFPATLALPVGPVSGDLLLEWNSSATGDYVTAPGSPTYGIPAGYTISTSADSTDGRNGTWHDIVTVTGNTARTREHRFPFAGARWVKMTVTSSVPGPLGNTLNIDQIDLHDAANGTDDSVFFLGDSITMEAFTRCPADQPSFAELIHKAAPQRFPAMIDGGVGGVNSGYGVSVIQDWLDLNPDFQVWAIGYGTNDAWQKVPPSSFDKNLQTLVDRIKAAGRVPVIARIPYASKGPADADIQALNKVVDLVTARNGLLPGPDLYAWFSAHQDQLGSDGVHPSDVGAQSINRLWYEALQPLYGIKP
jgi:lysophospholipase L1-like esterase